MGTRYVGAGTLSEPVQILTIQETEPGRFRFSVTVSPVTKSRPRASRLRRQR